MPKGGKMERQTVTVKDKTKTHRSVSERKKDKSQADSCRRLHCGTGETSCHWRRYVRVLLMLPCSPFVVTEMEKQSCVLLQGTGLAGSAHGAVMQFSFFSPNDGVI